MPSWILVPCLVKLRSEFNELAPERDHASDGSIGNAAHAKESSDHNPDETGNTPTKDADNINEVHAIDVDDDLRKAGWNMDRCLGIIITRHRNGTDNRLQNVIYNRRIWSRSWGWTARAYNGASAHTEHAHFSARYTTAQESDTRPWGLVDEEEIVDSAQEDRIASKAAAKVWDAAGGAPDNREDAFERLADVDQRVEDIKTEQERQGKVLDALAVKAGIGPVPPGRPGV